MFQFVSHYYQVSQCCIYVCELLTVSLNKLCINNKFSAEFSQSYIWHQTMKFWDWSWFQASATMLMRSALFWDITWHPNILGQRIGPICNGQGSEKKRKPANHNVDSISRLLITITAHLPIENLCYGLPAFFSSQTPDRWGWDWYVVPKHR